MRIIAIILSGEVVNLALWDGSTAWDPISVGHCDTTVDVTGIPGAEVGGAYAGPTGPLATGGAFSPAAPIAGQPDTPGFAAAVVASSAITQATKLLVANWEPALANAIAAGNTTLVSQVWSMLITANSIVSSDTSAVAALAAAFNVPGITA